eukprot:3941582-Rhodomonas_salina.3
MLDRTTISNKTDGITEEEEEEDQQGGMLSLEERRRLVDEIRREKLPSGPATACPLCPYAPATTRPVLTMRTRYNASGTDAARRGTSGESTYHGAPRLVLFRAHIVRRFKQIGRSPKRTRRKPRKQKVQA